MWCTGQGSVVSPCRITSRATSSRQHRSTLQRTYSSPLQWPCARRRGANRAAAGSEDGSGVAEHGANARARQTAERAREHMSTAGEEVRHTGEHVREAVDVVRKSDNGLGAVGKKVEEVQDSLEHAQEEAREAVASPVEAIADSLDEEAAVDGEGGGKLASAIRGEFGEYDFDDAQLQVIDKLVTGIRGCAVASGAVAMLEILTTVGKALYGGGARDAVLIVGGVHINNFAVILDYGLTSVLLFMAAKSFKRVLKGSGHQLQFVMQGLLQLGFVFMQASTITASMGVIQLLQAARRWPPLVTWVTGISAAAAGVRAVALARVLSRYTPGSGKALAVVLAMRGGMADNIRRRMHWTDRLALNVVGGLVLPLTVAGEEQKFPGSKEEEGLQREPEGAKQARKEGRTPAVDTPEEAAAPAHEYEFQPQEEQLLELVMNGMRVAGIALALQALSTVALAVATLVHAGGWLELGWDAWNFGFHLTDQAWRAALLFVAAGFFCRAITSAGHDIENLITALGERGLGGLFTQTQKITKGVASGLVIGWVLSGYNVAKKVGWI